MAIPFSIVNGILRQKAKWQGDERWWVRFANVLSLYYVACQSLSLLFQLIFDFETVSAPGPTSPGIWKTVFKLAIFLVVVVTANLKRVPKPISSVAMISLVIYFLYSTVLDCFMLGRFDGRAVGLWFFLAGIILLMEMSGRAWRWQLGDWPQSVIYLLGALFVFGSFYYPHIKSSLGGGMHTPVTILFTKDSVLLPNKSADVYLIDESEAGLYVIGKNDKKATFIPRNEIGLVYFSENLSDISLSKMK